MIAEQTEGMMFAKHFNYRMEQAKEQLPPPKLEQSVRRKRSGR